MDICLINNVLKVHPKIFSEYLVKCPTIRNRLHKQGTVCLRLEEVYDLKSKKGIVFIDMTKKVYAVISNELIREYFNRQTGIGGSNKGLFIFSVKNMLIDFKIELKPLKVEFKWNY